MPRVTVLDVDSEGEPVPDGVWCIVYGLGFERASGLKFSLHLVPAEDQGPLRKAKGWIVPYIRIYVHTRTSLYVYIRI